MLYLRVATRECVAIGIFDSLFGGNTSAGTTQGVQNGIAALGQGLSSGNDALTNYTGQANNALTSNTQSGLGALTSGYGDAVGALQSGGAQAQGQLTGGVNNATGTILGGNTAYQPYVSGGQGASTMLANSLGLNGAGGNAAATSAFQASPGYQYQVDQSTGAAERAAAAAGGLGSGSMLSAITQIGSNLANSEYSNWQSNLQGLGTQGLNAANSVSGNNQAAGQIQYGGGSTGAQLAQNLGQSIGTADTGLASGQANLYGGLGSGLSNNLTGLGSGLSTNDMNEAANVAGLQLKAGQAQDSAANANSGILSKLVGGVLGLPFGGTSLSGTSLTSGGSSNSGGGGLLGPSITSAGKAIASFL